MIKDIKVLIKVSNKNLKHYKRYYDNVKSGDSIYVSVDEIPSGSNVKVVGICDFCGSERHVSLKEYNNQTSFGNFGFSCSKKCSLHKTQRTLMDKFGVKSVFQLDFIKDKIKNTKNEKYGDEKYNNRTLSESTCLKKYGVHHISMLDEVKKKKIETNIKNIGVEYPSQSQSIMNKMIKTNLQKYGVGNFASTDVFKKIIKDKWFQKMSDKIDKFGSLIISDGGNYTIKCSKCDIEYDILNNLKNIRIRNGFDVCTNCNPKKQNIIESELFEFIKENYYLSVLRNVRVFNNKEIDIFIPDLKLGFEFNGLYWHSEIYKDRMYHLDKTLSYLDNNINIMHIWEDDWLYKKEIIKSIILNKLSMTTHKIFARNCVVMEVFDNKLIRDFLDKNHIQGFIGSRVKLGLFYKGELVSLMTFGNFRKSLGQKSYDGCYEMLRFCNKLNHVVVGGSSKLFKFFLKNYNPLKVISYSDVSRYDGNMYIKLGFKFKSMTPPNYYWVVNGVRKHRFNFRKDKLVRKGYDSNMTETQIMNGLGYYRIFDCGNKKWVFDL